MTHFDPLNEILDGQLRALARSTPFMKLYFENLYSLMPYYEVFRQKYLFFVYFFQFFCQIFDKSSNFDCYESSYNSVAQKL